MAYSHRVWKKCETWRRGQDRGKCARLAGQCCCGLVCVVRGCGSKVPPPTFSPRVVSYSSLKACRLYSRSYQKFVVSIL